MGGVITRKQRIKYLEEQLAETTDETRRREIEWEIEGLKLKLLHPPVMVCGIPPSILRELNITARKAKPKRKPKKEE